MASAKHGENDLCAADDLFSRIYSEPRKCSSGSRARNRVSKSARNMFSSTFSNVFWIAVFGTWEVLVRVPQSGAKYSGKMRAAALDCPAGVPSSSGLLKDHSQLWVGLVGRHADKAAANEAMPAADDIAQQQASPHGRIVVRRNRDRH
ncbi:hypothetical protein LMG27174_01570 [Paraburkholderia rhynchosiae]|uniref:Uncharacterized protein n=1 Tax=Paraburkholderia rhynchosiae TaxID=487049 RepID=A0A6J5ABX7_9BURK|nr:hypothetical protein LMG27174_01570 [Paraburkholderia rhynchosiae]